MELLLVEGPAEPAKPASRTGVLGESWIAWGAAALLALAAIGVSFVHFRETPSAEPVLQLSVPVPGNAAAGFIAISPDGRRLLLEVMSAGKTQLWLRPLDSPQLQALAGTENARGPFWSSDGKYIGFFMGDKLKIMPASGGPAQILCDGTGLGGEGTWNRDGVILFSSSGVGDPLRRVNATGGECVTVLKPEAGASYEVPEFLPDGKHFVYQGISTDESKRGVYVASLDNPLPRRILADNSVAMFAPSTSGKNYGYLLFSRGSTLMAQPFNTGTLQTAGDVFPVAEEVSDDNNAKAAASVSAGGTLVYETNFAFDLKTVWLDRTGKELSKVGEVQNEGGTALSPDGKTDATYRSEEGNAGIGIWLYDLQRGGATRFTGTGLNASSPVWSPDGKYVAFGADKGLYVKDASGGLKEELLLENENIKLPSDWSRDGRYLIYTETGSKGQGDIWYLPDPLSKSADKKPVLFQGTEAMESQGQLSPDGRWLAYVSNETGETQVYVRPFPSGPGRWKISASGVESREPRWRPDGKELFYLEDRVPDSRLLAAAVKPSMANEFQSSTPQVLFEFRGVGFVPQENTFLYSSSAGGQRFLVRVQANNAPPTVNVITNWEKAALGAK